jgi:ABC-type Fe3+ transport system permease subunit
MRNFDASPHPTPDRGTAQTGVTPALTIADGRITRESARYATITARNYTPKIYELGRWQHATLGLFAAYSAFTVLLPGFMSGLGIAPVIFYQLTLAKAFASVSLTKCREMWDFANVGLAFKNALFMALWVPTIRMLFRSIFSWSIVKARLKGSRVLDVLAFLPHADTGCRFRCCAYDDMARHRAILIVALTLLTFRGTKALCPKPLEN